MCTCTCSCVIQHAHHPWLISQPEKILSPALEVGGSCALPVALCFNACLHACPSVCLRRAHGGWPRDYGQVRQVRPQRGDHVSAVFVSPCRRSAANLSRRPQAARMACPPGCLNGRAEQLQPSCLPGRESLLPAIVPVSVSVSAVPFGASVVVGAMVAGLARRENRLLAPFFPPIVSLCCALLYSTAFPTHRHASCKPPSCITCHGFSVTEAETAKCMRFFVLAFSAGSLFCEGEGGGCSSFAAVLLFCH